MEENTDMTAQHISRGLEKRLGNMSLPPQKPKIELASQFKQSLKILRSLTIHFSNQISKMHGPVEC